MLSRSDRFQAILGVAAIAGIAILFLIFALPLPRDPKFWIGNSGLLEIIGGLLTPVVAILAGLAAWQSYGINRRGELSTQFQRAAELLTKPETVQQVAGLALLQHCARAAPAEYTAPAMQTLTFFIGSADRKDKDRAWRAAEQKQELPASIWPETHGVAYHALEAIGAICPERKWPPSVSTEGLLVVPSFYEVGSETRDLDLSMLWILRAIVGRKAYRNCRFRGSRLQIVVVREQLRFIGCDLTDAQIDVRILKEPDRPARRPFDVLEFDECSTAGAKLNGGSLEMWVAAQAVDREEARKRKTEEQKRLAEAMRAFDPGAD